MFHSRTVPSSPTEANRDPAGAKALRAGGARGISTHVDDRTVFTVIIYVLTTGCA
jgi:transposase